MGFISELFDLQRIDLEIDRLKEALSRIESQLGERAALDLALAELAEEEEKLSQMKKRQRELEWELADVEGRIRVLEGKLYGGSVRNPKELKGLQAEVELMKKRRGGEEDRILESMDEVEGLDNALRARRNEVAKMEEEWKATQDSLYKEKARLQSELSDLTAKRQDTVSRVEPSTLRLYEILRGTKQGLAVAMVERGKCCGCSIVLPMADLQRARLGREVVHCNSCGRILYVS